MTNLENQVQSGDGPAGALPFIYGHVNPDLFPIEQIQAAAQQALEQYGHLALNYGPERGCPLLLDYLREKMARDQGLQLGAENLMLTNGVSDGLDTVCRLYTQPGDTVLVEAPSYHEALDIIRDYPVRLVAVPLDEQGLNVEVLAERLPALKAQGHPPRLLYTIPTFQNPSGVTLSAARRTALLGLAKKHAFMIVEDDVYRDLSFEGQPPASLYALDAADGGHSVIHLGSFSKILAPGLRLGWAISAPEHVTRLAESGLGRASGGASPLVAFMTAVFCQHGWLEPHITRLIEAYRHRRDVMLNALEQVMPTEVRWTRPQGGFFVWLTLPKPLEARQVLEHAHQHDITFLTGEPFFAQGDGTRHIRLPFSFIPPSDMADGIHELAHIIRDLLQDV
jgi:2-aminoadipate transaminase